MITSEPMKDQKQKTFRSHQGANLDARNEAMTPTGAICLTLAFAGMMLLTHGCETVKSGTTSTVDYLRGSVLMVLPHTIDEVCSAALLAFEDLQLTATEKRCDALTGLLVSLNAQGKTITIKFNRTEIDQTEIAVQVGALGDKEQSMIIIGQIREYL